MNDTQQIEGFLDRTLSPQEQLLMEARLLIDRGLQEKVQWQQRSHELIRAYGRKQLRLDIERAQQRVFTEKAFSSFRQIINTIFR